MEHASEILIIILASLLSIFLVTGIALMIIVIKLTNRVKQIVESAHGIVDSVESAADTLKNAAGPLAAARIIANIVDMVSKKKNKGKG